MFYARFLIEQFFRKIKPKGLIIVDEILKGKYGGLRSLPLLLKIFQNYQNYFSEMVIAWIKPRQNAGVLELMGIPSNVLFCSYSEIPFKDDLLTIVYVVSSHTLDKIFSIAEHQPTIFVVPSEEVSILQEQITLAEKMCERPVHYLSLWSMEKPSETIYDSKNLAFHILAKHLGFSKCSLAEFIMSSSFIKLCANKNIPLRAFTDWVDTSESFKVIASS